MSSLIIRASIQLLRMAHLFVVIFVVTGCLFPHRWLLIHIIFLPLMILQWQLNQGTCILTNIENALLRKPPEKKEQQGQFVKKLLSCCCKTLPSDTQIKFGLYVLLIVSWSISIYRFITD